MWCREAEDAKWKQEKLKEKQEEEEEKARAAAEAAEAARREKEEYEKWMGSFSIESGGTVDDAQQEESQVAFPFQPFLSFRSSFLSNPFFNSFFRHARVIPEAGTPLGIHFAHQPAEGGLPSAFTVICRRYRRCRWCNSTRWPTHSSSRPWR
jgi:hypothetical protein